MATLAQHSSLHRISALAIMTQAISTLQHWIEVSHQRRLLAKLDHDQLDDLGIDRAPALAEASKPFWK